MSELKEKIKVMVNKDAKKFLDAGKESYNLPRDLAEKDKKKISGDLI